MMPTIKEANEIKLDNKSIDAIANKLIEKTDENRESRKQLQELRSKRQNRINSNSPEQLPSDINNSNLPEQLQLNDNISNLPEQLQLNDNDSNLTEQPQSGNIPNMVADDIQDRCGDGKCSLTGGIIEVLMKPKTEIANCRDCGLGVPHAHVGDIDECPNCTSTRNFIKSKFDEVVASRIVKREKKSKDKRTRR